jgi:hypothetical protein
MASRRGNKRPAGLFGLTAQICGIPAPGAEKHLSIKTALDREFFLRKNMTESQ